ncbi:hypothetical protein GCM10028790_36940 [Micromonospora taraxaci]
MTDDPTRAGRVEGVELLGITHPTGALPRLVPWSPPACNPPGWTGPSSAGEFCDQRHTAVINLTTGPDVIVPPRERPVAERTMCDDGNDAP